MEIWNMIKGVCWQLTDMYCPKGVESKHYQQIIPTVTIFTGGMRTDYIPPECEMHIDIRFPALIKVENLINEIRKTVLNFKEIYQQQFSKKFQIRENISSFLEGYETKEDEIIIEALKSAIFQILNDKPKIMKETGTPVINTIGAQYKIPSITYGPGEPKLDDMDNEFIEIDEYLKSIEIYSKFYDKLFEMYHSKHKN